MGVLSCAVKGGILLCVWLNLNHVLSYWCDGLVVVGAPSNAQQPLQPARSKRLGRLYCGVWMKKSCDRTTTQCIASLLAAHMTGFYFNCCPLLEICPARRADSDKAAGYFWRIWTNAPAVNTERTWIFVPNLYLFLLWGFCTLGSASLSHLATRRQVSNQPDYEADSWSPLLSQDFNKNALHLNLLPSLEAAQSQLCVTIGEARVADIWSFHLELCSGYRHTPLIVKCLKCCNSSSFFPPAGPFHPICTRFRRLQSSKKLLCWRFVVMEGPTTCSLLVRFEQKPCFRMIFE